MQRLLGKWLIELAAAGTFLIALIWLGGLLVAKVSGWWPEFPHWPLLCAVVVWGFVFMMATPVLSAVLGKLLALAIVVAKSPRQAGVILIAGVVVLAAWFLSLPLWLDIPPLAAGLLCLAHVALARAAWRSLVRYYDKTRESEPSDRGES